MTCNSTYMFPVNIEKAASQIYCLIDELDGKKIDKKHWRGYHPRAYNKVNKESLDSIVRYLCERLQNEDVSKYSLEMQIWWRDHQEADAKRNEKECLEEKIKDQENDS